MTMTAMTEMKLFKTKGPENWGRNTEYPTNREEATVKNPRIVMMGTPPTFFFTKSGDELNMSLRR